MSDSTVLPLDVFLAGSIKFVHSTKVKSVQNFAGMAKPMPFVRINLNTGMKIDISVERGEDLKVLAEAVVAASKQAGDLTANVYTAICEWMISSDMEAKKIGIMVCGNGIHQFLPNDANMAKPGAHSGRERNIIPAMPRTPFVF